MKDYQNIIDQYERYLDGELDETAKTDMENAIAKDKELSEILEGHKLMLDGIRYSARKDLKNKMAAWDTAMSHIDDQSVDQPKVRKFKWYYAAASVVLIAFSVTFVIQYNANTYPRIASNHYVQFESSSSFTRSDNADRNPDSQLIEQYALGNFDAAITNAEGRALADMSVDAKFHLGCAYMAEKRYDDAIEVFEGLSETNNSRSAGSKWFMALAYLYKDNPDQALPILQDLAAGMSSYASKASAVLDDLD